MPPAFARGLAAIVNDTHRWHVRRGRDTRKPHAPVVILEVEEERWIEAAGPVDRFAAHQHERAGERGHAEDFAGRLDVNQIAHFVMMEPAAEQRPYDTGREASQQQIEHRRITLAEVMMPAVGSPRHWRQRAHFGMRVQPLDRTDKRIGRHLDVGIHHQVIVGAGPVENEIVRGAIADVRVTVAQNQAHAGVIEARLADLEHLLRDLRILAVVDQSEVHRFECSRGARRTDRELELAQYALENPQIRAVRDDADLQRRRQHGGGVYPVRACCSLGRQYRWGGRDC